VYHLSEVAMNDRNNTSALTRLELQNMAKAQQTKKPKEESLQSLLENKNEDNEGKRPWFDFNNWRTLALVISFVSIVVILVLGLAALVTSVEAGSSAEQAFAFDALLGLASSGCVVWRFYKNIAPCEVPSKERKACVLIALGFILSAIVMLTRAIYCLAYKVEPLQSITVIAISTLGTLCYGLLFYVKFKVAQKLHSVAMRTDSYDSACGAVMAFGVLVSAIVYKHAPETWWIDPVIALITAMVTFIYGIFVLAKVVVKRRFGEPEEYEQF